MTDLRARRFRGPHGAELAWREIGDGTPLVLLHGLMGSGALMASDGPARAIAERGYRVILPDLRGHGESGRPHAGAQALTPPATTPPRATVISATRPFMSGISRYRQSELAGKLCSTGK